MVAVGANRLPSWHGTPEPADAERIGNGWSEARRLLALSMPDLRLRKAS